MAINAIQVKISITPVVQPCPPKGGKFAVTATVNGIAGGNGGSYDVFIYDEDVLNDDLLDSSVANGVLAGKFKAVHNFTLECDGSCNVIGPKGSSGESTAEIYAYADGGGGVTSKSKVIDVTCGDAPAEDSTTARSSRVRKEEHVAKK